MIHGFTIITGVLQHTWSFGSRSQACVDERLSLISNTCREVGTNRTVPAYPHDGTRRLGGQPFWHQCMLVQVALLLAFKVA
jgi:hypothetical protein